MVSCSLLESYFTFSVNFWQREYINFSRILTTPCLFNNKMLKRHWGCIRLKKEEKCPTMVINHSQQRTNNYQETTSILQKSFSQSHTFKNQIVYKHHQCSIDKSNYVFTVEKVWGPKTMHSTMPLFGTTIGVQNFGFHPANPWRLITRITLANLKSCSVVVPTCQCRNCKSPNIMLIGNMFLVGIGPP
jgi:hypothetical protein